MGLEIERRFLITKPENIHPLKNPKQIIQCYPPINVWRNLWPGDLKDVEYLFEDKYLVLRIRVVDDLGIVTIKGGGDGIIREEFEEVGDLSEIMSVIDSNLFPTITKKRYNLLDDSGLIWEIDFFENEYCGLIIAEIELPRIDYPIKIPKWTNKEITNNGNEWSNFSLAIKSHQKNNVFD